MKTFMAEGKKCVEFNSYLLKGAMCGLCSPESSRRIVQDKIFFDRKEAANFMNNCGTWIKSLGDYANTFQIIAHTLRYNEAGKLEDSAPEEIDFISYWKSDKDFSKEKVQEHWDNCKLVDEKSFTLESVNPSSGCSEIVRNYIGLGPLIKFDQKQKNKVLELDRRLKVIYDQKVATTTKDYKKDDKLNRKLQSAGLEFVPANGLEQIFWSDAKTFVSTYMDDDMFQQNLYTMGKGSNLKGFNVNEYEIFNLKNNCMLAPEFQGVIQGYTNIRNDKKQTLCAKTTNSCCTPKYYEKLEGDWKLISANAKTNIELFNKLLQSIHEWLRRTTKDDKSGKYFSTLETKLDELQALPSCDAMCKNLITSVNVFRVVNNDNQILPHTKEQTTRCLNYGMVLKNAVRCAVCDMDYLNTFIEDTQNGKKLKIAKIDSEGCNQILDQCLVSIQL